MTKIGLTLPSFVEDPELPDRGTTLLFGWPDPLAPASWPWQANWVVGDGQDISKDNEGEAEKSADARALVINLVSYLVGAPFGRWDVRYATGEKSAPELPDLLARLGIRTLGAFAALPARAVVARFGAPGEAAHRLARGLDERPLAARTPPPDLAVAMGATV